MKILGIESSADETAAAVVEDGQRLLSNVVASQIDIHSEYGGIIPEIAARSHIEVINPVVNQALYDADLTWDDIDAIAVTYAPGLIGSLLIGTLAARTYALIKNKPLYPVHHVEAHVYANFLTEVGVSSSGVVDGDEGVEGRRFGVEDRIWKVEDSRKLAEPPLVGKSERTSATRLTKLMSRSDTAQTKHLQPESSLLRTQGRPEAKPFGADSVRKGSLTLPTKQPDFPLLALIVSGGHTQLVLFRSHGDYELIGRTQDDAVGEAYDKVAKIIGLPYPGGPSIAQAAEHGDPLKYKLPKAKLASRYDFSFSGLKTAVLRAVQREVGVDITFPSFELAGLLSDQQRNDFAASFQKTANETLVDKTISAFNAHQPKSVVIAGGVAADRNLRKKLADKLPITITYAPPQLCTDNAAMVATLGYYYAQKKPAVNPRTLTVSPSMSMDDTAWAKG